MDNIQRLAARKQAMLRQINDALRSFTHDTGMQVDKLFIDKKVKPKPFYAGAPVTIIYESGATISPK